jgi:phosphoglycolate/pyridoxal phosphate phosphatase family enzyme
VVRLTDCYELLSQSDVFIFDCDGVIWKGDFLIDGAAETLAMLRGCGKKILFVTNNSTKSRKGYLGKFESLGLKVFADEIFSSSFAAAAYFQQDPLPPGKKVYVIGQEGIGEELDLIGVSHIGGPQDANKTVHIAPGAKVEHDPDVGAVVVGFDRALNYYKIQYAQLCINENPGCRFIATNLDAVANLTEQQEWAGNGSMVGAIKGCTGREPIVVAKPSSLIIDFIVDKFKVEKDRICMVGDRLDTDILFGRDNGLKTLLTLSGVTKESTLVSPSNDIIPDFVVDSIADLLKGGDRPLYSVVRC